MARYDNLSTQLQQTIYNNSSGDIKGNTLQAQLISFINTLGKGSNFMGILTDSNKPTSLPDGKQFYIGYNNSSTAISVNLTAVGLGTLSITKSNLYIVYCDDTGWAAVDIAAGLASAITPNDGLLRIMHNGVAITDFSANQSGNTVADIPVTKVILVDEHDNEYGSFMASQKEDDDIKIMIPSGGGSSSVGTLTLVMGQFSDTYTGTAKTINLPTPGNGTLRVRHASWSDPVDFSANQSSNQSFEIPTTKVKIVASDGTTELGSFLACQKERVPDIVIPGGGGGGGGISTLSMSGASGSHLSFSPASSSSSSASFTLSVASGYSIPSTTDQSNWSSVYDNLGSLNKKNWKNYYSSNGTKAHVDDVYSDYCKINLLKENSVYFLESVQGFDFLGYGYDVSSHECAKKQETYIIVEVASSFTIDFQNQTHHIIANGLSATLDAGEKYLITVIGYFWRIEKYV